MRIETRPFNDQRPGTSGLRKPVTTFQQEHYLENFVQSLLDCIEGEEPPRLVLGGDGRYYNDTAIQTIIAMASANGVRELVIGQHGILSTPAASALIRELECDGGIVLSASHNPGGPDGDFGIKFNSANGGPAPESLTEKIYRRSCELDAYHLSPIETVELGQTREFQVGDLQVRIVDTIGPYVTLLQKLFDFDLIRDYLKSSGKKIAIDAMHAVTGPYAASIMQSLEQDSLLLRATPLPDFGGGHPDPSPAHCAELASLLVNSDRYLMGAASDGDGDRNLILGGEGMVAPGDSLAIILANAKHIPGYRDGVSGVARSMPTSRAADRVAAQMQLPCFETPTGWKYFGNLLDAGEITFCGEESFGTSSDHVREKDGLWAICFWINLLATRRATVTDIVHSHWDRFGRNACRRFDYEAIDTDAANALTSALRDAVPTLAARADAAIQVQHADEFEYHDPVDGSISRGQGIRIELAGGDRIVYRLSGTGTRGATLRMYLEAQASAADWRQADLDGRLGSLGRFGHALARVEHFTGRDAPSQVT